MTEKKSLYAQQMEEAQTITGAQFKAGLQELVQLLLRQSAANMLLVAGTALSTVIIGLEQAARCYSDSGDLPMREMYMHLAKTLKDIWEATNKQSDHYWATSLAQVQRDFLTQYAPASKPGGTIQ